MRPSKLPVLVLVLWLGATLLWWGFAFMPLPSAPPEWLTAARVACFGSAEITRGRILVDAEQPCLRGRLQDRSRMPPGAPG